MEQKVRYSLFLVMFLVSIFVGTAQERVPIHDPVMIKAGDTFYVFSTGWGISVKSSTDLKNWKREKRVFEEAPAWTKEAVEGFRGHMWAPDIAFFNDQYYLFYSVSAFGKNTSCIGLATNKTLDPESPDFKWVDQGKIIQSYPGKTNWNAIDPNFILDKDGTPYLSFGSFWDGLKLVKLSWDGLRVEDDLENIPTIASRKTKPGEPNPPAIDDNPKDAGGNAIEAPFIFKKGKYYYLFASIDYCCKGPRSTYKIIVGRSKDLTGPYVDKEGYEMRYGGGSIVLQGNENWYGIGHNAVYTYDGKDYMLCHGYDAGDKGKSKLIVTELSWKKGWPIVEEEF